MRQTVNEPAFSKKTVGSCRHIRTPEIKNIIKTLAIFFVFDILVVDSRKVITCHLDSCREMSSHIIYHLVVQNYQIDVKL